MFKVTIIVLSLLRFVIAGSNPVTGCVPWIIETNTDSEMMEVDDNDSTPGYDNLHGTANVNSNFLSVNSQ